MVEATRGQRRGAWAATDPRLTRVVVDSRAVVPGVLFVALKGEKHDGHTFLPSVFEQGAAAALVEHVPSGCESSPLIVVPSTVNALADMARYAFERHPRLEVVGITGSLGKTTTKEVVASVLATKRSVLKTEGNLNSEIGLPLTVLNGLRSENEIAVLEMAMYQRGDVRFLAQLARPRVGIVTAVLPVHLERLGTIERIQQAKQELVEELPSHGVAVLNADDARVASMAAATSARVVRYGVTPDAEVRAEAIRSHGLEGVEFDLVQHGERQHVHLPLLGAQSVHAALAAAAVAAEEGLTLSDTSEALQRLSPALRLLVIDGINGSRIVDDSYNASPESVLAALNLLRELPGRRKIAVLGDMLELGSEEEPSHRRVGRRAAETVDMLIVYGPRSETTAEEAVACGLRRDQVFRSDSHPSTVALLRSELQPDDDVLVKGSLAMGMSEVVRGIRAEEQA